MPRDRAFDSIIVGAGSAGCVLANRLSADLERSVLLIEAGGKDRNPLFRLPMLMGRLFHSGIYNWRYHTEPVPSLGGRALYWPRGKVLGGSSTINGMIYVRGNRHDYDRWAQMGLAGWSYADVLPAFCRSEGHVERDGAYHGTGGELSVCRARGVNPLFDVFVEAGRQAGWPVNDDFNGAEQQGFGRYDFTIRRGKRCSTSAAFLRPVRHRRNLAIATDCLVRRVVVEGGRATGVEVAEGVHPRTIRAEREVILCAGTVNSPQLLMLSGIGPGEELKRHGIPVVHELPGVGRNLQDHVDCVLAYACTKPGSGQRTLVKAVAGLADVTGGDIHLSGTDARRASPAQRRALGLRVIPFERNSEGLSLTSALWRTGLSASFFKGRCSVSSTRPPCSADATSPSRPGACATRPRARMPAHSPAATPKKSSSRARSIRMRALSSQPNRRAGSISAPRPSSGRRWGRRPGRVAACC